MNTRPKAPVGSAATPRRKLPAHGVEAAGKRAPGQARASPETESGGVGSPGVEGTRVCEGHCASQVTRGPGAHKPEPERPESQSGFPPLAPLPPCPRGPARGVTLASPAPFLLFHPGQSTA